MKVKYHPLPAISQGFINKQKYFLLFETSLFNRDNFTSYIFIEPIDVIEIRCYEDIARAFEEIERYSKIHYLAGYFSYELGYYFEKNSFTVESFSSFPLIRLYIFDRSISFNHKTGQTNADITGLFAKTNKHSEFTINNLRLGFNQSDYIKKIDCIKEYIRRGETYQVNFTGKYHFNFSGSVFSFYQDLKNRQDVYYGAFCKFKDEYIISLSPELYFKRDIFKISSRPMKGTIERGKNIQEDEEQILKLKRSAKDLAENVMIVDLIRNDLGRISDICSVKTSSLFDIEKYNTLFQMTSTIQSILRKGISYFDIFRSLFPGGSVTGAPKIRTMQIIKELENGCRKVYCGALGIIFPHNKAIFNLPIRTISLFKNKGEMGVGSGITIDSDPVKEFQECVLKARFLTDRVKKFKLIETILWGEGYKFLKEHMDRMRNSALYFGFHFERSKIISELKSTEAKFKKKFNYKVRVLLDKEGGAKIDYSKIINDSFAKEKYIAVSKYKTDSANLFFYHKTTNRNLYDSEYEHYRKKGYFDVIFLNDRNEVTEGAISNIIIEINRKKYTPPISSGLLPGIFRNFFIAHHKVEEKVISIDDVWKADKIFLCNSVRGLTEVKIK